jgi:hypothetical protein
MEVLDFDNFAANPERELSLSSPDLRESGQRTTRYAAAGRTIVLVRSKKQTHKPTAVQH